MGTSSLPPDPPPVKPLNVPKPREPTPPDDPTLPTKYLDITQFKAPEDMEGEEEMSAQAGSANPNPDMNQLTLMLQQGMSIDEVAKSMNIKLDEQTFELLTTLKQQLDLASALAKQSAISQPGTVLGEQGDVGKTYDYSQHGGVASDINSVSAPPPPPQGHIAGSEYPQEPAYPQPRDQPDSAFYGDSRDPYTSYDNRNMDLCGDSNLQRTSDGSFRDKSAKGGMDYSGYGSDSASAYPTDPVRSGYNRYGEAEPRPGAQKQYSYGSDNGETVHSHRNSSTSSFSGGSSGPPSILSPPPFRKSDSVSSFGQHQDEGKYSHGRGGMGRKSPSFAGHFGRSGPQSGPRPLLMDHDRGRGRGGFGRGHYSKGKW